ncbi:MAG: SDR family oxidoreductase [Chloroflexota bacterium]
MRTPLFEPSGSALVTGASRGIGKAVALGLAEAGVPVAVNYRRGRDEAEEVVRCICECGGRAVAVQADIAVPEDAAGLLDRCEQALGPLAILVNNAGITQDRLLVQMAESDWMATWTTDLAGPRALALEAGARMAQRGHGRVVNVGSVVGVIGNSGQANYAAAKSALSGLTRHLAVQYAQHNVTVNCVVPGYIVTDATAHLTSEQSNGWLRRIPMERYGVPREVADLILFLTARQAGYITGQCIAVDGGFLASAGVFVVS